MDSQAKNELYNIRRELSSIISELESISDGITRDFAGIGEGSCAAAIKKVANNYYTVQRKLNNIDTTTVTESFAQANGGGGGFR